ncbi:hypothetical protein [Pandoraea aquatica]|nr:hypothetical protein [Pandoraea aquatica]
MFFQTPDVSHRVQDSVTMFDDGLITLRIPGTDWRVPLMPECFSDAEGGVTNHEREQLFGLRPDVSGQTLDAMYVATRAGLSPERARSLSDWHVKQGDAYAAAHRDTLATLEFVSACEIALNVDDWFRAVSCLERAKQHLVRCEDLEWAEVEGACLVDMFDACGLRLTAGEVALVLALTLHDRHGCASAVSRFSDLARSRYEEAQLPVSLTWDSVAVNRGIREVIWHQQDALGAGGLSFLTYLIQMDDARDPISSTVFERHSNQQWQLMDWNESTPGGERIMKLVLSDTINELAPNGRGINPRRNCYFCDGDVMQGQFLLDVLLAAKRANMSGGASPRVALSDGHEEGVEDGGGLRRRRNH